MLFRQAIILKCPTHLRFSNGMTGFCQTRRMANDVAVRRVSIFKQKSGVNVSSPPPRADMRSGYFVLAAAGAPSAVADEEIKAVRLHQTTPISTNLILA